ncbi:MAG: ABC transporter permease [bacterium]
MNLIETIKEAVETLRLHKLRSILTMLGIIIGVASIIGLLSISISSQKKILQEMEVIGSDIIWINSTSKTSNNQKGIFCPQRKLGQKDIVAMKRQCSAIVDLAKEVRDFQRVTYSNKHFTCDILGVEPVYQSVRKLILIEGRFITSFDLVSCRKVCVIEDSKEIKKLFGLINPLGKEMLISGLSFNVIGKIACKNKGLGMESTPKIYLPLTTLQKINGTKRVDLIYAKVKSYNLVEKGKQQVAIVLAQRYGRNHSFEVESASEMIEATKDIMNIITLVGIGIASISLLVGGIGIANVMLVSVTERKREIGIRKAIGAKKQQILIQFLIEALTLSLIGGFIGIGLGVSVGNIFNLLLELPLSFHWWVVLIGFLFSAIVGSFSGFYPAMQAAKLNPIESLRYE